MYRIVIVLAFAACVHTQLTPLAGFDPARPKTCWQAVRLYGDPQQVGAPYVELAYLHASATDQVADTKVIKSLRVKAAEAGANGVLFHGITEAAGGVGWVTSAWQKKPSGSGTAVWISRDSAATMATCADTLHAPPPSP